jgi:glycosyltransferase involved in cell wall biosynthesis
MNLLMLSGDRTLASGERGPFYAMLTEFATYWDRIDIICPRPAARKPELVPRNVWVHPSPAGRPFQPAYIYVKGRGLLRERPYHLMVSHDYGLFYNGAGAGLLKRGAAIRWISEVHHVEGYPRADGWRHRSRTLTAYGYVRWARARVDGFRTVCCQVSELLRRWGVEETKILLLRSLYLDLRLFSAAPERSKDVDILCCARLEREKGLDILLDAVRILTRRRPDLRVLIVGRGRLRKTVMRTIAGYDLVRNVELVDWVGDAEAMAATYRRSRVLVCTSLSEGNPRVVGEAMASGIAVISTPVGIVPELVQNGENGLTIDWNAEDLAAKAALLLDHRRLYRRICAAAARSVREFDAKEVICRLATAYQEIAAGR